MRIWLANWILAISFSSLHHMAPQISNSSLVEWCHTLALSFAIHHLNSSMMSQSKLVKEDGKDMKTARKLRWSRLNRKMFNVKRQDWKTAKNTPPLPISIIIIIATPPAPTPLTPMLTSILASLPLHQWRPSIHRPHNAKHHISPVKTNPQSMNTPLNCPLQWATMRWIEPLVLILPSLNWVWIPTPLNCNCLQSATSPSPWLHHPPWLQMICMCWRRLMIFWMIELVVDCNCRLWSIELRTMTPSPSSPFANWWEVTISHWTEKCSTMCWLA